MKTAETEAAEAADRSRREAVNDASLREDGEDAPAEREPLDAGAAEAGEEDTGVAEAGAAEAGAAEAGAADAGAADTGDEDTGDEDEEVDDDDRSVEATAPASEPLPPSSSVAPRPPAITASVFGRTDVGQIREHNEDNFLIADLGARVRGIGASKKEMKLGRGGLLFVVCDGMGGAAAGEVASQLAADIVYERMLQAAGHGDRDRLAVDVVEALEVAGARILQQATENRAHRGMGTTATVAALVDDHLLLGQVGDSRAYILRGDRFVQVTRDQSLVNQLLEAGQLTEEEAENFEHSNIILQALGTAEAVQVDLTYARLYRGDVLLMCSDGLSGMIRDGEIRDTLVHVDDVEEACRVLIDDANQAGGHDNITVIAARFDGEGLASLEDGEAEPLRYAKYSLPAWIDDHAGATQRVGALDGLDGYDDTPTIEITGEFEIDADTSWDDLLDAPQIPKEEGAVPNLVIYVAVAVLVFALYYFIAR